MLTPLPGLADAARDIAALVESRFVAVGEKLDRSIAILSSLTDVFGTLSAELESEAVREATRDLSDAAMRVGEFEVSRAEQATTLAALGRLIASIERHTLAMGAAIKAASSLAVNVKIEASSMGTVGEDFLAFAGDIERSLRRAQQDLQNFAQELAQLARQLAAALDQDSAISHRHAKAIETIPRRLAASVGTMAERRQRATQAVQAFGTKSRQIGAGVGAAVMALQVGDSIRQRAEHVSQALIDVESVVANLDAPVGLAGTCCALQSAQLADAAQTVDAEIRRIVASLQQLARDAGDIVLTGTEAFGAGGAGAGSFLGAVEADVSEARRLLDDYEAGRASANRAVSAVSDAAGRLQQHILRIRSMESDLRIMGLNTTLKCGRIGGQARSLAAIAQELRRYAATMATEAEAVMTDMTQLASTAEVLTSSTGSGDQHPVAEMMSGATARLAATAHSLDQALLQLEGDSGAVATLLRDTVGGMSVHDEIGRAMRTIAASLTQHVANLGTAPGGTVASEPVLTRMAERYTMAQERDVHASALGIAAPPSGAEADDDVLF